MSTTDVSNTTSFVRIDGMLAMTAPRIPE